MRYINFDKWKSLIKGSYGIIYKITNTINGKLYFGQSILSQMFERARQHEKTHDNCKALNEAISKYGWDAFILEIIDVAYTKEELDEKEIYWIAKYNTCHGVGYNCTEGGSSGKRCTESKNKVVGINNPKSKGYILAVSVEGKRNNWEVTEFIGVADSALALANELGMKSSRVIDHVLSGRNKSRITGGYHFMYLEDNEAQAYLPYLITNKAS